MITENSIIAIINRSTLKIIEEISINEFNFKYKNSKVKKLNLFKMITG